MPGPQVKWSPKWPPFYQQGPWSSERLTCLCCTAGCKRRIWTQAIRLQNPPPLSNTAPSCPYEWITTVRNVLSLLPKASFSLRSKYTRKRPNLCIVTRCFLEGQTSIFFPIILLRPLKWPSHRDGLVKWKSMLSFHTLGTPLAFSFPLSSLPHSKHLS